MLTEYDVMGGLKMADLESNVPKTRLYTISRFQPQPMFDLEELRGSFS